MQGADAYRVVFDVAKSRYDWQLPAIGLLFIPVGALLIWLAPRAGWTGTKRWLGYYFIGFSMLFSGLVFLVTWPQHSRAKGAFRTEIVSSVEGPVTDFRPMPYEGHQDECFTVQAKTFCYSDYDMTAGFHNSASHGGPIREGLPVRVFYVGDMIVRLEVRADLLPSEVERKAVARREESESEAQMRHDPAIVRLEMGFSVAVLFFVAWWNIQPQRFMRLWIEPPYKPLTIRLFRLFFAANLVGAAVYLGREIAHFQGTSSDYLIAAEIAAAWMWGMWVMFRLVEAYGTRYRRHSTR